MSARDHIHSELMRLDVPTSIAWPLSGRSDADRLALARALVPECAVVPVEPTEAMLQAGTHAGRRKSQDAMSPTPTEHPDDGGGSLGYAYRAMLAAAKETQA